MNNSASFERLWKEHEPQLRRFAMKISGGNRDAGEDLIQDTAVKCMTSLPSFKQDCPFENWAMRIMFRCRLDDQRRKRQTEISIDSFVDGFFAVSQSIEADVIAQESLDRATQLAREIPAGLVFLQGILEGWSQVEMASSARISVPAAKNRCFRLRRNLRFLLAS